MESIPTFIWIFLQHSFMNNCTFCRIIKGLSPAAFVYQNEFAVAFMDRFPLSKGHVLVVPKKHYEQIYDMDVEEAAKLFKVVYKVAGMIQKTLEPDGMRIVQNNGGAAGQVIPHVHFHLIPAYYHTPLKREGVSMEELEEIASLIRRGLK